MGLGGWVGVVISIILFYRACMAVECIDIGAYRGPGFWVLGSGYRVLGSGFWVPYWYYSYMFREGLDICFHVGQIWRLG